jgi:hypothetical protein
MSATRSSPLPKRYVGITLAILCAIPLAILLWPIPLHSESFTVSSAPLQRTYLLTVEYPSAATVGEKFAFVVHLSAVNSEIAEAPASMGAMQLNSNSLAFDPAGVVSAPFPSTKPVTYTWQSIPSQSGDAALTLFFSKQSIKDSTGKLEEQPAWAKSFDVSVRPGIGAWKNPALFFSGCGLVFGLLLFLISHIPPRRQRK